MHQHGNDYIHVKLLYFTLVLSVPAVPPDGAVGKTENLGDEFFETFHYLI